MHIFEVTPSVQNSKHLTMTDNAFVLYVCLYYISQRKLWIGLETNKKKKTGLDTGAEGQSGTVKQVRRTRWREKRRMAIDFNEALSTSRNLIRWHSRENETEGVLNRECVIERGRHNVTDVMGSPKASSCLYTLAAQQPAGRCSYSFTYCCSRYPESMCCESVFVSGCAFVCMCVSLELI